MNDNTQKSNVEKLKQRNIFEEIKNKVEPIKPTPQDKPSVLKQWLEYQKIIDEVLGK